MAKDKKKAVSMGGEGAITLRFWRGGRSVGARNLDGAEVLSRRIEARAARVREAHAGAPQDWTVVQAARSSVE